MDDPVLPDEWQDVGEEYPSRPGDDLDDFVLTREGHPETLVIHGDTDEEYIKTDQSGLMPAEDME